MEENIMAPQRVSGNGDKITYPYFFLEIPTLSAGKYLSVSETQLTAWQDMMAGMPHNAVNNALWESMREAEKQFHFRREGMENSTIVTPPHFEFDPAI